MNNFRIADENGRELFKQYASNQTWYKYIKESKDDYASWDISYWSGGTMIIGEIKVRESYDSKAFIEWDYEEKKHNALLELKEKMQLKYPKKRIEIQYINIFKNEAIKIWTTTNIHNEQTPVLKLRPATTYGQTTMINKSVYSCDLNIEAFRGMLNWIDEPEQNNDDDDNLPF